MSGQTPSQTVGPFFHAALPWESGAQVGTGVEIVGRVLDGDGQPVPDALIEIWQADPEGRYNPGGDFIGFGRAATDASGAYRFATLMPGPVAGPENSLQAPHIAVGVLARGLLVRAEGEKAWRFDIVLQGAAETVFFDC
jgi:protocatechuate 3,4-dioxygenase alpha subunit